MDRARQYTTVKDFERRNPQEVEYFDAVYDHQMLLNESQRPAEVREVALGTVPKGYPASSFSKAANGARPWAAAADDSEASKLVTETWEEYAVRVPVREANLNRYFAEQEAADHAEAVRVEERAKGSAAAVARLMAYQQASNEKHYRPVQHTLRSDFEAMTEAKMRSERISIVEAMLASRGEMMKGSEAPARRAIEVAAAESFQRVLDILEQQRQARVAEEQRRLDEQRRREAEKKAEEERKKAAEAAAEVARKQAEAEAKQAEQKRRNDERKAKARAEREQRAKQTRNSIAGLAGGGEGGALDVAGQTLADLDMTVASGTLGASGTQGGGGSTTPRDGTGSIDAGNGSHDRRASSAAPRSISNGAVAPSADIVDISA